MKQGRSHATRLRRPCLAGTAAAGPRCLNAACARPHITRHPAPWSLATTSRAPYGDGRPAPRPHSDAGVSLAVPHDLGHAPRSSRDSLPAVIERPVATRPTLRQPVLPRTFPSARRHSVRACPSTSALSPLRTHSCGQKCPISPAQDVPQQNGLGRIITGTFRSSLIPRTPHTVATPQHGKSRRQKAARDVPRSRVTYCDFMPRAGMRLPPDYAAESLHVGTSGALTARAVDDRYHNNESGQIYLQR